MTNMIQVGSDLDGAGVFIISTRPDDILHKIGTPGPDSGPGFMILKVKVVTTL